MFQGNEASYPLEMCSHCKFFLIATLYCYRSEFYLGIDMYSFHVCYAVYILTKRAKLKGLKITFGNNTTFAVRL